MPAVAVVAAVALSEVGITAAAVGSAVLGAEAAAATIIGATTIGEAVGGAIIGAGTGALSAAVQGGDIGKGALGGFIGGGFTPVLTGAVSSALSPGTAFIDLNGPVPMAPSVGGSEAFGKGLASGIGKFGGSTLAGLATGQPIQQALKSGLVSGLAGGLGTGIGAATDLGSTGTSLLSGALGFGLSQAFAPSAKATSISAQAPTQAPTTQYNLGSLSSGAPSGGLGSALFAAPGFGYSPGSPVFGTSEGDKAPTQKAWGGENKSLRDVGETVT